MHAFQATAPGGTSPERSGTGAPAIAARTCVVQFVKFGIVGVSNTLLTFVVYTVLLKGFGVWYLAASAIGFVVGATNGFLLEPPLDLPRARRRRAHAGALGDRAGDAGWRSTSGLLYLFVHEAGLDKLLGQALRHGDRDACSRSSPTAPGPSASTPTTCRWLADGEV